MNTQDALKYGRKIKRHARTLAELGDVARWVATDANWWLTEKSRTLGIVGADGMVDVSGEVARAFVRGFRGAAA